VPAGATTADDPDYPRELRELASSLGLGERVELPGFVANVADVLSRLTVSVNATCRGEPGFGMEGLGAAMLEASWAGLPVVATRGGGSHQGMQDGATGTLVEPADPRALAAAAGPTCATASLPCAPGRPVAASRASVSCQRSSLLAFSLRWKRPPAPGSRAS
jgi:Glycosyl transferases group 1